MFDKKCFALFPEHMVPKGVSPFETPTATPSGSRLLGAPCARFIPPLLKRMRRARQTENRLILDRATSA
jgi:hypothetical protein